MSKEITKGRLKTTFQSGEEIVLEKNFEDIRYFYRKNNENSRKKILEFYFDSFKENNKKDYYNYGDRVVNLTDPVVKVEYSYLLHDFTTNTEEEITLFSSSDINFNSVTSEFEVGAQAGKFEQDVKNDLYLSSLIKIAYFFN